MFLAAVDINLIIVASQVAGAVIVGVLGYDKHSEKLVAAVVILDAISLKMIESVCAEDQVQFPYIPGLFSFRELPPLVKAFSKLKKQT